MELGSTEGQIQSNDSDNFNVLPIQSGQVPTTAYQQHLCRFAQLQYDKCPWQAVLDDFANKIWVWQDEGDNIIVCTNMNEDICLQWLKQYFLDLDLVEILTALHDPLAPAIHNQGNSQLMAYTHLTTCVKLSKEDTLLLAKGVK